MVYKNLFYRSLFSLIFLAIYLIALSNQYLLFCLGSTIYFFVFYEIFKFFKKCLIVIIFYLISSYLFFILYIFIFYDFNLFNIFILSIIIFDSFSYFIGSLIGKYIIFKVISPKKTLEGYLGGVFFTNLFLFMYLFLFQNELEIKISILLINLIIITSIIGDLIESYFKRINKIKDSSNYLPGHGGYFDRFDSFISSIIFLTLFSALII